MTRVIVAVIVGYIVSIVLTVLGLAFALMGMGGEPQPRPADWAGREVGFAEAGAVASDPTWFSFAIPFVGALGVLTGANLVTRRDQLEPSQRRHRR